ncbi:hypothetical protein [Ramlibacter rhizophilus]|uniref:Uncharacterized protein n=1 Tax=Ramlibacter rhizophilus TaxID=1781167 RepID=A0A4Z0BC85_9BURK|nr:hypothetical protein [Ramlibacter rhizophilus]TFY96846.1 hypothetical protein EZ242_19420 [Ramlibacter rhizophilus]
MTPRFAHTRASAAARTVIARLVIWFVVAATLAGAATGWLQARDPLWQPAHGSAQSRIGTVLLLLVVAAAITLHRGICSARLRRRMIRAAAGLE